MDLDGGVAGRWLAVVRYSIGSISKQLTTAAVLLLAEDGKLTLDEPVGKYVPGLTRGDAVNPLRPGTSASGSPRRSGG